MYIDINKIIENLIIDGERGTIGTFRNGLSIGKYEIEHILDDIEKGNLSIWSASSKVEELEKHLRRKILYSLKEKNISIEYISTSSGSEEEYVNEYPAFFEWEVIGILAYPAVEGYYTKEDVAWMRKLLNTPFELPGEERLKIYREWNKYWEERESEDKSKNSPFTK